MNTRKTTWKVTLASLMVMLGLSAGAVLPAATAYADANATVQQGVNQVGGTENPTSLESFIKSVIGVLFFVVGSVSVIMLIVGGIMYASASGDQGRIKTAKDTVLYAVIGLVVAILAYAIVNFVLKNVK